MEQTALFEGVVALPNPWPYPATDSTPEDPDGHALAVVSSLRCPSDSYGREPAVNPGNNRRIQSVTNIAVCYGDGANRLQFDDTGSGPFEGDISTRGMFYWSRGRNFSFITDGLSNTLLISESIVAPMGASNDIRGGIAVDTTIDLDGGTWLWRPQVCMALPTEGKSFVGTAPNQWRHSRYLDGMVLYSGFNTIMPPNSKSCVKNQSEATSGFYSANSNHTGGVNVARVDGSVSFISNTIDTNGLPDSVQGGRLQGPSPYGVWGALGTPCSGETASL